MSLNRYAAKPDGNQTEIVEALRAAGYVVWIIGWPVDLLVGTGKAWLPMEVKMPGKDTQLTANQRKFIAVGGGPISVVSDAEAAVRAARSLG